MGRKARLIEKLRANPSNVAFEDLDKLLIWCGFECRQPGGGSSHYIYRRAGYRNYCLARHRPMLKRYVLDVIKHVEAYGDLDED